MARILFTTFGSYGDLHPYIAIGLELRKRGHSITIATSEQYRERVEAQGLAFHAVRPDLNAADPSTVEYFFDARRGSERVIRFISDCARETYEDTLPAVEQADLVVTQIMTLAAIAAVERVGKPWVSTVLAPSSLLSAYDPPVLPQAPFLVYFRIFGPQVMRRLFSVGKRQSRGWLEGLIALRNALGLPVEAHPFFEGANSPRRALALFSKHFMDAPPDWPSQLRVTGFPFFDELNGDTRLDGFLKAGPAPIVFTLGSSAVNAAGNFYQESLKAAKQLGQRSVLLTGALPQGLPEQLSADCIAVPYAPFARILPRASVIVHQGGIGTTAQALRSGRPMLVVPFAHDQFDNAEQVRRCGVGQTLPRSKYNLARATLHLQKLLDDARYASASAAIAERIAEEHGAECAATEIEATLSGKDS